jgi:hypothetical protein
MAIEQTVKAQNGETEANRTLSLTSSLDRVGSQGHAPAAVPSGKRLGTHLVGWLQV